METKLARDGQAWIYDWVLQKTGRAIQFQGDLHGWLPPTVRQHDMISKQIGLGALRLETLAREELAAGHSQTALELFYEASGTYANAQHPILETTEEKRLLHGAGVRCFDEAAKLAPYPVERVAIPFDGGSAHANLHLLSGSEPAPCVIFIPGCDMTKEMFPHPLHNQAIQRGMHLVSVDGPGQGQNNIDGVRLTADNYATAMLAVIDYLLERPEVGEIAIWGLSFGSLWAAQTAIRDDKAKAVALPWASICDLYYLMTYDSPRYKRLMAYITGSETEEELDRVLAGMGVADRIGEISAPTLLTAGEYDPRSPLRELVEIYDTMTCDRELWVFADQHHGTTMTGRVSITERSIWDFDTISWTLDWLRDRFDDKPVADSGEVIYLTRDATTPHGPRAKKGRTWIEALGVGDALANGPSSR